MSIPKLSEESSERPPTRGTLQINADRSVAGFNDVVTSDMGAENDPAGRKFTEEEMAIHRLHREACEVRWITSFVLKSSDVLLNLITAITHD